MDKQLPPSEISHPSVTIDEVNRVLEVGRLLLSVLTPEEIEELREWFSSQREMGNAGDS